MSNEYYNRTAQFAPRTKARSDDVRDELDSIEIGFDKLPSLADLGSGRLNYGTATGLGNAYEVTIPAPFESYVVGQPIVFLADRANTGASSININNKGVIPLARQDGTPLRANDIQADSIMYALYNGTQFRLASSTAAMVANAEAAQNAAQASQQAAATSESNALASQNSAATSAANALTSEQNALASENAASGHAATSIAARDTTLGYRYDTFLHRNEAATFASASANSATASANSATNAAGSASTATTQASNAANSATNAANSASAANSDRLVVESIYDTFDDRYLGVKASAPTLDNDGQPLLTGALYFNSTNNDTYVYTGSSWVTVSSTASSDLAFQYRNDAQTAASNASSSASNAASSASSALSSANSATASANSATTSANTATSAANAASTSASNASTSANNAASSASSASSSASSASTSATNAATSASSAAQSASIAAEIAVGDVRNYFDLDFKPSTPPSLSLDFSDEDYRLIEEGIETGMPLEDILTVTNGAATRVNHLGQIVPTAPNTPRIDWTGGKRKLLVEEQRTNLLTWSEDFSNAAWSKSLTTIISNTVTAPDGNLTADKLVEISSTGGKALRVFNALQSGSQTASMFIKAGERSSFTFLVLVGSQIGSKHINLLTEEVLIGATNIPITHSLTKMANGWFKLSCTFTVPTLPTSTDYFDIRLSNTWPINSGTGMNYTGDGTSGIYIWGAQLEQASTPSSYIPTQASAVTRLADNVSRVLGEEFNSGEGTIVVRGVSPLDLITRQLALLRSGGAEVYALATFGGTGRIRGQGISSTGIGVIGTAAPFIGALAYKGNQLRGSFNGSAITVLDANITLTPESIVIGANASVTGGFINSGISDVRYYPKALSDSELIELTKV